MQDRAWFYVVTSLLVVSVLAAGSLALLGGSRPARPSPPTSFDASPTVYRNLSIVWNPIGHDFDYNQLQLEVPLHARVVFTVANFDPATSYAPSASDLRVTGTIGTDMTVTGSGSVSRLTTVDATRISHTFSMSNGFYHLNVPVPAAQGPASPTVVRFIVEFDHPGTFAWGCVLICTDPSMGPEMYGSLSVS